MGFEKKELMKVFGIGSGKGQNANEKKQELIKVSEIGSGKGSKCQ
jgi:hypothetical protein